MKTRLWIVVMLACASAVAGAQGQNGPRNTPAQLTPLAEHAQVHPGAGAHLALKVRLPEGLHAQSNKPKDKAAKPTRLAISAPAGVTVREIVFPPTTEITLPYFDQPAPVFEREFVIGVALGIAADVKTGPMTITGRLTYQACDDKVCYLSRTLPAEWTLAAVPPANEILSSGDTSVFDAIAWGTGEKSTSEVDFPSKTPVSTVSAGKSTSEVDLSRLDDFEVQGTPGGGYMTVKEFLQFLHDAEADVKAKSMFEGRGPLAILALVFIGGFFLNLTPCVLPMIPINLAIIGAGAGTGNKGRGWLLGGVYGGAMALVYGVLGLIVILTAGTFGGINASPWFNAGIALLFVVLGLAMFDIGAIDLSRFSSGIRFDQNSRGTLFLAFSMGAVAALLAGACVAPVVIQVVFFATNLYAGGNAIALALPFVLGLGMAVPWPLAGAGIAALPKPGRWMNRVKYVFGVFILMTAVYYGYEAYSLFSNRWVDPASVRASVDEQLKSGWHASLAEGLATAQRNHTPVLIDMWATWCKNCLTMDKTTLADPAVQQALSGYTKIKFQAEDLDASPAKDLAARFDVVGLPAYIVLKPRK